MPRRSPWTSLVTMPRSLTLALLVVGGAACNTTAQTTSQAPSGPANAASSQEARVATTSPSQRPMGSQPDAPLAEFCGAPNAEPCPTLTAHLGALRAKECLAQPTPPTQSSCGGYTLVDVDYGVVGYTRYFNSGGDLVGAIAHVYEYGGSRRYGTIPPPCSGSPATSICPPTRSSSSAR